MSDFFVRLAERATGKACAVHPLFSSRYTSETEAQGISEIQAESPIGSSQPPNELSNRNAQGRMHSPDVSLVHQPPHIEQGRNNQSIPTPTDCTSVRSPFFSGSPRIGLEESPGVASTDNRQRTFREDSTRETTSTKPSNMPAERPAVLPVPTSLDPTRVVAMGDVDHRDFHAGMPVNRDPARAIPEQLAFHQDEPLTSPTPTRSNSAEQMRSATATVGNLSTQRAMEESDGVGSFEQRSTEPTAQFDVTTVPARMDAHRADVGPPVVRVTIGRIEVRAIMPAVMSERPRPNRTQPVISLDDYLKQGKGAVR